MLHPQGQNFSPIHLPIPWHEYHDIGGCVEQRPQVLAAVVHGGTTACP